MEFDKSKVYTALDADEARIRSRGYFANNIAELKRAVENNKEDYLSKIERILEDGFMCRFAAENGACYPFFYLIEESKETWSRPYKDLNEMLEDYLCKK